VVDDVIGATADADHATVLYGDITPAPIAAQDARGLHPCVDCCGFDAGR
jgi:hypothetical protein